eukprot:MONOS_5601.1-p1 / transcript=MONOS_5601.1 / gene=MONOS_5601 / organism=Monocercomonoides_exilis_PA203 / gene_product=Nucleobase:Cation Symporter-2 (NCS2) Family Protein / transcript_product=Nucleobase:Cation Symporter-2 (NCS2) Family Protein / location=Mono_scaffold00165:29761-31434(+) / protein_length=558 / sequence_SO=supercontig / SO=protein_coding / is_pseudo=false
MGKPDVLGPTWYSVFIASCIGAFVGTSVMSLFANMPFIQAPGLGLAFQVGLLLSGGTGLPYSYAAGMTLVVLSGVIFLLITIIGWREHIFNAVPQGIRAAVPVGIGMFIAFVGLKNSFLIVKSENSLIGLQEFRKIFTTKDPQLQERISSSFICFFGFLLIGLLDHFSVPGGVLIGMITCTLIGIPCGVTHLNSIKQGWNVFKAFSGFFSFNQEKGGTFGMFALGFKDCFTGKHIITSVVTIITFFLVNLFDTMGTLHGCAVSAGLLDETGKVINFGRCMWADALATFVGGILGSSSVSTFVESAAGITAGARTGLSSAIAALLFVLSVFISPIFSIIPSAASSPALVFVGVKMFSTAKYIPMEDTKLAVPIFLTIIMMPLTFSITNGIGLGMLSHTFISGTIWIADIIKWGFNRKKFDKNRQSEQPKSDNKEDTMTEQGDNYDSRISEEGKSFSDSYESERGNREDNRNEVYVETMDDNNSQFANVEKRKSHQMLTLSPSSTSNIHPEACHHTSSSSSSSASTTNQLNLRPKCPISIVTCIISLLFLVMFLLPVDL